MNDEQKQRVRTSFAKVERVPEIVGLVFYRRLFELDPGLRRLFRHDIQEQSLKLVSTLKMAIDSLEQPREVQAALQALGRRHIQYGVKEEHYDTVGAALVWTLECTLGPEFDAAVRASWLELYNWLAETMKEAARAAEKSFDTSRFLASAPQEKV
jgi:hemoglobin-like flavoprotein